MRRKTKIRYIFIFILPPLTLYSLFVIYPLIGSLIISFYKWPGVGPMTFIGFDNFKSLFAGYFSSQLWNAFSHNIIFFFFTSMLELGLGFFIALIIASNIRGGNYFKTIIYIPNMIPMILVGFLWGLFLNPQIGFVNEFLKIIGLGSLAQPWLGSMSLAFPTVIAVNIWRNLGFYVLVLLAAILNIPNELLEAAYIDGASAWNAVWKIIFPLSFSTFRTLLLLLFIWSFNVFDIVYALEGAQGGPSGATDVLGTLFYRTAFGGLGSGATGMGLGAAVTVFIFAIIFPVSIIYVYSVERRSSS